MDSATEGNGAVASNFPSIPTKPYQRPNYAQIHQSPLPIKIYPLPAFIPQNPLSVLRIAYAVLSQCTSSSRSHDNPYKAYYSAADRSVHVTDPLAIRALWEKGFFGKGSLSRSEPNWFVGERRRLGIDNAETAEEYTRRRREERRQFKEERARQERMAIEERLNKEKRLAVGELQNGIVFSSNESEDATQRSTSSKVLSQTPIRQSPADSNAMENKEHLQLSPEEAFFLVYGLNMLEIVDPDTGLVNSATSLLRLFRGNSYFPPISYSSFQPDDPFLLRYVTYHHFRSLGWVVRSGIKFAVDFLLYNRGPAFTHAEFAIILLPSYSHPEWENSTFASLKGGERSWWWFHSLNRVQSHVKKTLVCVYIDVPPPSKDISRFGEDANIGSFLKHYRVREFVFKRWIANRSRD
ncbi:hypothetical protein M501DRAFT_1022577 [Patellaria atrata CBS 101060]|uniref:tRNA-splicing endonuclease subunit Sen2 n=1 Tax=Patellaria atrata CBS 101060 TaxID=1346257 RepID=A0A9P4SF52_9PEZI|nr:hypothetical protein M501DRAFT_1022577 [Patellaria atrata CBS 101060]